MTWLTVTEKLSQMTTDVFSLLSQSCPFLIHDLSPGCNKSNTMEATCGAGILFQRFLVRFVLLDLNCLCNVFVDHCPFAFGSLDCLSVQ